MMTTLLPETLPAPGEEFFEESPSYMVEIEPSIEWALSSSKMKIGEPFQL